MNNFNQGEERYLYWKLQDVDGINQKRHTKKKGIQCSWIINHRELILLQCPYYPKPCTDSVQSLSRYQWHFLQKTLSNQSNPEKEQQSGRHRLSDFKLYYKYFWKKLIGEKLYFYIQSLRCIILFSNMTYFYKHK